MNDAQHADLVDRGTMILYAVREFFALGPEYRVAVVIQKHADVNQVNLFSEIGALQFGEIAQRLINQTLTNEDVVIEAIRKAAHG